ncbi:TraM recognition domain-containing protein [Acetobacter sacchari]|uniref:TraM recognition domain-containing protein n=1 Tax=Acetobacter sacchari TaxID=2661687 RepID=A0ABS3LW63_9PROT|nr:TraM recognition domain-containing protein [Acetobacter sacchari]MBO1360154.1 TraM recognition domain-containing protein [Acetobacter sacchari]
MVKRQIGGPQSHQQIRRGATYRDTRPLLDRFVEEMRTSTSGFVLFVLAGVSWLAPAVIGLTLPLAILVTIWVVTRRPVLPFHMPRYSGLADEHDLDPETRKPKKAGGIVYLGTEARTGQQLWLSSDAARQHAAMPGTTGAGKTTSAISLLANPLAHGSGFLLIDGKGDNTVYGDGLALTRRYGLDDQILSLNLLTASSIRESNTFNPFATGNADAIREMLVSQLGEPVANDANGVFRDRAVNLIGTLTPALVWMRDRHGVSINIETIRFATELRWLATLARHRIFLVRNPGQNQPVKIPVPDIPDDVLYPFQAYLGELPGYDIGLEWNQQKESRPSEQHGFATMYFSKIFTQFAVSLGHIFKVENGDIDMRDVVLNRRVLLVILPSLENSSDTLAGLGKIIVASVRAVMAQLLGARLNGPAEEIFKLKAGSGDAPYQFFFDELSAYATDGMDRMLAMGRGLNCMFWLGFQDLPGLTTRIGDKAFTLLGNANLTHAMRLQDAMRTREWIEKQSDRVEVTQATHYEGNSAGSYREGRGAEIREVARIPWADLQSLIEGEAITMFAGRVVHSKTFFAKVNGRTGVIRTAQPVMLSAPIVLDGSAPDDETRAVLETIENGSYRSELHTPVTEPAFERLCAEIRSIGDDAASLGRAFPVISSALVGLSVEPVPGSDNALISFPARREEAERTPFTIMLRDAALSPKPGYRTPPSPRPPLDGVLLGTLDAIERTIDPRPGVARKQALLLLGVRARVIGDARRYEAELPEPSEPRVLARRIHELSRRLVA